MDRKQIVRNSSYRHCMTEYRQQDLTVVNGVDIAPLVDPELNRRIARAGEDAPRRQRRVP